MIRPFMTAFVEYILLFIVIKYGKEHKWIIAAILFFLASYQLGEVLVLLTNGEQWAFKVAYIATTMLPPLGMLLVGRVLKKELGYYIFQALSLFFVAFIVVTPQIILNFEFILCCIRINEYHPFLSQYWLFYYQGTLILTMFVALLGHVFSKNVEIKAKLKWILIAYFSFDGIAMVIFYINPAMQASIASVMCALAVFAAFIFTKIALQGTFTFDKLFKKFRQYNE